MMATFGENLRRLRKSRHMTQAALAAALGVSESAVGMYEQNRRLPSFEQAEEIADYFSVDLMYLLGHREVVEQITGTDADDDADIAAKVSAHELQLLEAYRLTSDDTRSAVDRILRIEA